MKEVPYHMVCSCNPRNGGSGVCGCTMANRPVLVDDDWPESNINIEYIRYPPYDKELLVDAIISKFSQPKEVKIKLPSEEFISDMIENWEDKKISKWQGIQAIIQHIKEINGIKD